MNVPSAETWYQTTAALDIFLAALWAVGLILFIMLSMASKVVAVPNVDVARWLPTGWRFWLPLLVIAVALRVPRLDTSFWYDETFTAAIARLPIDKLIVALSGDVHPPMYYVLAKIFGAPYGYSEISLRMPSFIAGMALIYVVYHLALDITKDETTAKISGFLIATFPTMIHYSAEARYPMMLALVVSLAWLAIRKNDRSSFLFATYFSMMLHATGMIYAGVLIIYAFYTRRWWVANAVLVGFALLYVSFTAIQMADFENGFWLYRMLPLWHVVDGMLLKPFAETMLVTYTAVIVLALGGSVWMIRNGAGKTYWLWIGLFVPLSVFIIGVVWHPVYLPRALIASVVPIIIGIAAVMRGHWLPSAALIAVIAISVVFYLTDERADLRELFAQCEGADYVYTTSTNMAVIALYYAPATPTTYENGNNQHQEMSMTARLAMGFDFIPPEVIPGKYCAVVQWSYYTTPEEITRIAQLRSYGESEITPVDAFMTYEIIRWTND